MFDDIAVSVQIGCGVEFSNGALTINNWQYRAPLEARRHLNRTDTQNERLTYKLWILLINKKFFNVVINEKGIENKECQ